MGLKFNPFTGNLDFTGGSGGGAVDSVNTKTGAVVLNQDDIGDGTTYKQYSATEKTKLAGIEALADVTDAANVGAAGAFMKSVDNADNITVGTTNKFATAAEKTKLGFISVTQAVDLDAIEINADNVPGIKTKTDFISITQAVDLDAVEANANNVPGIKTKTDWITVTQAVDLDAMETAVATISSKQPLDSDLTDIAALNSAGSGVIATDGAGWIQKSYSALKTALGLTKADVGLSNVDNTSDATKNAAAVALTNKTISGTNNTFSNIPNSAITGLGSLALASSVTASQISDATTAGRNMITAANVAAQTALLDTFTSGAKGLVPASGGGTTTFLRADGTFATPPGGGSGSPGGATGEVQYNDGAGGFAGAANVEVDGGNLKLVSTTDPTAPTGGLLMYSKSIAGRHLPKIIGPSGIDTVLQVGLHGNAVFMVAPASGTTAPTAWGGTLTTAATMSVQQTIASANPWLATWRKRFATSTTAGNLSGMRTAYTQWFRGNAAGFGGFFFRAQLGHNINLNGSQLFVGLCASTGALAATAGSVAALVNMIGMGYDTTDANTGNWFFYRNDGSGTATKVDLGATNAARSNVSHGYDLIMYSPPNGSDLYVRIVNLHNNAVVLDTSYNTDLPAVNTGMAFKAEVNNGAVAAAANLEVAKVYIETDYQMFYIQQQ